MLELNWVIENVEWDTATGAVQKVKWLCWAVENDVDATYRGTCEFPADHNDPSFIPLQSLSESTVIDWVKNQVDVSVVENALRRRLDAQKPTEEGLPWN